MLHLELSYSGRHCPRKIIENLRVTSLYIFCTETFSDQGVFAPLTVRSEKFSVQKITDGSMAFPISFFKRLKLVKNGYMRIEISFLNVPLDVIGSVDEFLTFTDEWDTSYISPEMVK